MIGNGIWLSAGARLFKHVLVMHDAGSEAAIHAMRAMFEDNNTHAALLVDATNTLILLTIKLSCIISLYTVSILLYYLKNTYGALIRLFTTGEGELAFTEGITQGDPLAMAMYVCPCCYSID